MAKQGHYNYIPMTLRASYKGNRSLFGDDVLSSLVLQQVQARELEKIVCVCCMHRQCRAQTCRGIAA